MQGGAANPARSRRVFGRRCGLTAVAKVDFSKFGIVEVNGCAALRTFPVKTCPAAGWCFPTLPYTKKRTCPSWKNSAIQLEQRMGREGVKLSPLAFIMKAAVSALKAFPEFNASLDGDEPGAEKLLQHRFRSRYAERLVVPVIKDVDQKG